MQVFYEDSCNEEPGKADRLKQRLDYRIENTKELFFFNIGFLYELTKFAVKDERRRKAKHIPNEIDKAFKPILFDNPLIDSIRNDDLLQKELKDRKVEDKIDKDKVKNCYFDLAKTDEHGEFILAKERPENFFKKFLLHAYKFMAKNEFFEEAVNDQFNFWKLDKSLIMGVMKKYIKAMPAEEGYFKSFYPDADILDDFAYLLLDNTIKCNQLNEERLEKALQNWDMDRVAKLDLILLKMALTELITFTTIPSKVTINEYVEISKVFSTDKSKEFINGILDRLMKKFIKEGIVVKEGRGLIDD
jgi:N utilization substance protein B